MQIDLPISVNLGHRHCALNLNYYRNAHFQILNKMKVQFGSDIHDLVVSLPTYSWVNLTYTLYPKTKRLCDISNICCIVDKFFCDVMVNLQKISDDNYTVVRQVSYRIGEIDKDNPRVTVEIEGDINETSNGST